MTDIKSLIKKRASIKAKLTLFSTYLNVVKSCEKLSETQLIEIEQRLNAFESLYEKYDTLQIHLEEAVDEPSEQYAERETFENLYYALIASARQLTLEESRPLKSRAEGADKESPRTQNIVLSANHLNASKVVLLSTAVVKVSDAAGNLHDARVLLDNGSTANFISEDFCRKLRIHIYPVKSNVRGINDQASACSHGCTIRLKSDHSNFEIGLDCYVISKVSSSIPSTYVHKDNISLPSNIVLADPNFYTPSSIDILVGAEIFWGIIGMNRITLGKNMPTLVESKLGWL
ncbi:hypothetical protein SFRURICE_005130, partial [Spodoptera frugiperda]